MPEGSVSIRDMLALAGDGRCVAAGSAAEVAGARRPSVLFPASVLAMITKDAMWVAWFPSCQAWGGPARQSRRRVVAPLPTVPLPGWGRPQDIPPASSAERHVPALGRANFCDLAL